MIDTKDLIGIPYRSRGRDEDGVDCWGLVRLVFAQRGIDLPSLADAYADASDTAQAADALLRHREGWLPVAAPQPGDLVLLRVAGADSHVGVYLGEQQFIHAREGHAVCVERLDAPAWRHRVSGYFSYQPGAISLTGAVHPLRTEVLHTAAAAGQTLRAMIEAQGLPSELLQYGHAWVNGLPVPFSAWGECIPLAGDRVEYRIVPRGGGGVLRTILTIAVMAVAAWVTAGASIAGTPMITGSVMGISYSSLAGAAVMMGGMALVNAIAPIRPAAQDGQAAGRGLLALIGGANQENNYGALPVVLGRHRFTPPLAASYHTSNTGNDNYLHLLLCWGYGPLQVEDLRIGETPISKYSDVTLLTVTGGEADYVGRLADVLDLYGKDTDEQQLNVTMAQADGWQTRVTAAETSRIELMFAWQQGLFGMDAKGNLQARDTRIDIEYRPVGGSTWFNVNGPLPRFQGRTFALPETPPRMPYRDEVIPQYRWHTIYLLSGAMALVSGPISASASFGAVWYEPGPGVTFREMRAAPVLPKGAAPLYHVCIRGDVQHALTDVRPAGSAGFALARTGLSYTVATGTLAALPYAIDLTRKSKDAFVQTIVIAVARGQYEVRCKRIDNEKQYDGDQSNPGYEACSWVALRSIANRRPVNPPRPLALTAIRIRATDQLNGNIEGISARVSSIGKGVNGARVASSNPADLFRLVLQHPGNAKAVPDSALDLAGLQQWATFCRQHGLHFNTVLTGQRPLLEVLKDICAAGRASPRLADGKWGVVVDQPKPLVVQHFTPHNSWGFEATRTLPEIPHAFRVHFANEEKDYQPDERIVFNDGYNAGNASLYEQIDLPGVTHSDQAFRLARFHLAQLKLRPEEYVINVDVEHLIAQRGDRVKVVHDVPMWGIGSGRIRDVLSATELRLDEDWPMEAGRQYGLCIRTQTGASVVATVAAQAVAGDYDTVTLTAPLAGVAPGDLCLFGELNAEAVDCLVKGIESTGNLTARITLVDYASGVFEADSEAIPAFESHLTLLARQARFQVAQQPALLRAESGTPALLRESTGRVVPTLQVSWVNPEALHPEVAQVECQLRDAGDVLWRPSVLLPLAAGVAVFTDVAEGSAYDVRARYVTASGVAGAWAELVTDHVIVGKTAPPATPQGFTASIDPAGFVDLAWQEVADADLAFYELRLADAGWGSEADCWRTPRNPYRLTLRAGGAYSLWLRAVDTSGNYSAEAARFDLSIAAPAAPAGFRTTVVDNTVMFYWSEPASQLAIDSYELRRGESWDAAEVVGTKYGLFTTVSEPRGGQFTYWLAAIDMAGNQSAPVLTRALVSAPPDFVLVSEQSFTPDQITANGVLEQGRLFCPVNATETWEQHFVSRGWASPADQVAAGYPVYLQPQTGGGVIERIVDFGAVLDTTRVMVSLAQVAITGAPALAVEIHTSTDGSAWALAAASDAVITGGFRYVKVVCTVTGGVVAVSKLTVTLDRKEKATGGSVAAQAADAGGSLVPITGFADVSAINATPRGTTPLNCVVSFSDVPNPTGFRVLVFNSSGVRVNATVDYTIRGV